MNRALFTFQLVFWYGLGLMSKIKANLKYTKEHEWLKIFSLSTTESYARELNVELYFRNIWQWS